MNKTEQFLREFNEAWLREDVQTVLDGVTDDIRFRMASEKGVQGKEDFGRMLREMSGSGQGFKLTIEQVILSGERAAVNGLIECRSPEAQKLTTYAFCDVYELAPGSSPRVKALTAYVMEVKSD
ncbi:nuclear transport factor 2 family protein [Natronospira bacteriovora]|uniref:Nuclear transport factor 2 family protein n=1 Tax=Natronospira bacteriovora TaxID=3069753 RepID=A0ABU0W441_9GAMM|nr:nuclear transport factor 2 family protein [Natronospira sp. AB-CW4]MDQ2068786.1 nuclear transport factor 2 family protein [Natronospira sp. AB-CW4]